MDMQMPGIDGIEATRKIRAVERFRSLPSTFISALTANILPEDRNRCLEAGMDAYLNKPVKLQAVADMLVEAENFHARRAAPK
jgi:CheY-like chemotaxis protein